MNIDPSVNVVVFELNRNGKTETVMAQGNTKAADCVQKVWLELKQKHRITEAEVNQIYSEWEPSADDIAFIEQIFPKIKVSYSFERPLTDDWDAAMADAAQIMARSMSKETNQATASDANSAELLPVLRNADSFSDIVASRPLIPGLALFLANVGPTSRGTLGIEYVMLGKLEQEQIDPEELWKHSFDNLMKGLSVNVAKDGEQSFFILKRQGGMASGAIGLADFRENVVGWIGSNRAIIGIPDPDTLIICAANSPLLSRIQQQILNSKYSGPVNLTPALLLLDNDRLSLDRKREIP